ncbi:MAG: TlpA disulfide reductase family protein [Gammaproteobacteria bacterium]|jgi:thiol-disulfide isomerase/thioredoxin
MFTNVAVLLIGLIIALPIFAAPGTNNNSDSHSSEYQVIASDGTELALTRYPAKGNQLIVWIAPGYGLQTRSSKIAEQLAMEAIEVWQIDLADALFMPHSTEQMRSLTGQYVADLIEAAYQETGKNIFVSARSYGAIPVLRGARVWQTREPADNYLKGAILFSPDLYITIPSLGLEPEYLPIASATNIPMMIIQDGIRGNRWYVNQLIMTLMKGGSQPLLKILPGVSALFFNEDDAPQTLQALAKLPQDIKTSIRLLEKFPAPTQPAKMTGRFVAQGSGIDSRLKEFKGQFLPPPIDLRDVSGKRYHRQNYLGQVTVVNFWATWCPPCVQEIPSLNRLRKKMKNTPFELISINYAESPQTIRRFLKQVNVDYPVLLDHSGKISVGWKVVAFPSTFIIGPDGKIHYGINAAIHWDAPNVIATLKALYRNRKGPTGNSAHTNPGPRPHP